MERTFREIEREANKTSGKTKKNLSERAKYQFEADSEDEAMEDEIEQNLDLLSGAAGRLNGLARATGDELDKHNIHLERVTGKVCRDVVGQRATPVVFSHISCANIVTERLRG